MKIKEGYMIREIAGQYVVVPLGARVVEFNGIITLSESGAFLWKKLVEGAETRELVESIVKEYDVDHTIAQKDVEEFIASVSEKNLLEQMVYK